MQESVMRPRFSPLVSFIAPMILFMILGGVESFTALRPYYPVVYSLKILIVTATVWMFRHAYPGPRGEGVFLGILVGAVGIVAWIALAQVPLDWLPATLVGKRVAYNPFEAIESPMGRWAFLAVRFFGLVVLVPWIEEVFWRGFLLRYLISDRFENVPIGTYSHLSFIVVTGGFALVHPEILAAIVWGAAINLLLYRTKNLWSTFAAHAVTNLLLGIYVLATGAWELW